MRHLGKQCAEPENSSCSMSDDSPTFARKGQTLLHHQTTPLQLKLIFTTAMHGITKFGFVHCNFNDDPVQLGQ